MKKLFKTIFHPIVWFLDNIESIVICGLIMAFPTTIEIYGFHIPGKHADVIWIGNTIIALLVYLFAVSATKREYEEKLRGSDEKLHNFINGFPTEEEVELYETELKEIDKKYSGEKAFHKIKEFIIRQRVELMLDKIKKY